MLSGMLNSKFQCFSCHILEGKFFTFFMASINVIIGVVLNCNIGGCVVASIVVPAGADAINNFLQLHISDLFTHKVLRWNNSLSKHRILQTIRCQICLHTTIGQSQGDTFRKSITNRQVKTSAVAMGVWSFGERVHTWSWTLVNGKHLQKRKNKAWCWLMFDNHSCICFRKVALIKLLLYPTSTPSTKLQPFPTQPSNSISQHPPIPGTFRRRGQSTTTGATKRCYAIAPHLGSYRLSFAVRHVQDICSPQGAAGGRGVTSIVTAAFAAHGICVGSGVGWGIWKKIWRMYVNNTRQCDWRFSL